MKNLLLIFFATVFCSPIFSQTTVIYEVYALKFGERNYYIPLKSAAVGYNGADSTKVYFMYWLLKGANGKLILVDAGFKEDADINPKFITFTQPDKLLEPLGIKPEDITDIIITHPHWDHIGGIDLYPNAMVWIQQEDYNYFVGASWQKDGDHGGFNKKDVEKVVKRNLENKLTLINGDNKEILPGIKVFTGSKHTFESQYVLVNNGKQNIILASDNSWFYFNLLKLLPIPITFNKKAYTKNLKRMITMVKDVDLVIPGHDPLVMTKFEQVAKNIVKIKK